MKIIGHRGARELAPENTLASIQAALDYHVDEIEIDVRVTKDGVAILYHDPEIHLGDRQQGLVIKNHSLAEIRQQKPDIALLEDAIRLVNKRARLMIELKPNEPIQSTVDTIHRVLSEGWQPSDFILGSFSQRTLIELHKALPSIETIVIGKFSGLLHARWRAQQLKTKNISLNHHTLWWGFIRLLVREGYTLYTYTLNDPKKAARFTRYGLYGVITDRPDLFKER